MKSNLLLLALLLWAVPAAATPVAGDVLDWSGVPTVDLTRVAAEAGGLPLLARDIPDFFVRPNWTDFRAGQPCLVFDFDGDGNQEFIFSSLESVQLASLDPRNLRQVHDQFNLPPRFTGRLDNKQRLGSGFTLQGPFDLDGDGTLEFVTWGATADLREWGFWMVEARRNGDRFTLHREAEFFLDSYPERRPDGQWDGRYAVIGAVPGLLPEPGRLALILTVSVAFDGYGRGVLAVDPYTGRTLWNFPCGPNPNPAQAAVVDLDGDGAPEIVFVGGGGENLQGELIGDTTDDHTRLFVLDDRGREKWSCRLCGPRSMGHLALADLDPRPGCELVTATRVAGLAEAVVRVHSPGGELLGQTILPESAGGLVASAAAPGRDPAVYLATSSGLIHAFGWTGSGLAPVRQATFSGPVTLSQNAVFSPEPVTRLYATDPSGALLILDPDLRPLAALPTDSPSFAMELPIIHHRNREFLPGLSYATQGPGIGWEIGPNPHALPTNPVLRRLARTPVWARSLVLLGALSLAAWNLPAARKRRNRAPVPATPPGDDHLHAARLHLLEDLELSGHGAIAPLRSLRRLLWLLDALKTGIDISEGLTTRLREIWTDCHRDDLPRLLIILRRAQTAGIAHPSLQAAMAALENSQRQLAELKDHGFAPEHLHELSGRLHREGSVAESALQALRQEIGRHFSCDLEQAVAKVLRANQEGLLSLGAAVETGWAAEAGGASPGAPAERLHCRIDPGELEFILDNLVGNACRAMEGAGRRQLRVTWQATNGMVKVLASDSGIGIATEDRETILHTRFSSKPGGGLGLPRSVSILRKYGGDLSILSSAPGRGTTFQLLLPRTPQP